MMTVVTAETVGSLRELVLFAEQHGFELLNLIQLGFTGGAIDNPEHFPTYGAWRDAIVDLTLFLSSRPQKVFVHLLFPHEDPVPLELYLPLKEAGLLSLLKEVWRIDLDAVGGCRTDGRSTCVAGHYSLTILPTGDVFGCTLMRHIPELRAGNIHEQPLSTIYQTSPVFQTLRADSTVQGCASFTADSKTFACGQCRAGSRSLRRVYPEHTPAQLSHLPMRF